MTVVLRPLTDSDWDDLLQVYLEGIATRQATFETEAPPWERWDVRLHEKLGFRKMGTRERIARHHGDWRDTVILERRSSNVGTA